MTEELNNTEVVEEVETVDAPEETQPKEETFTKTQLEEIVKQRVAREKKAAEKAVEEAKKLAKMNADEKERYEREQLEARLAEYERKEAQYGLAKEANNMLVEQGIQANDTIVELLVKNDAETTQSAVKTIIDWVNDLQKQWEVKRNTGVTPKKLENTPSDPFAEAIKKFK